MILIHGTLFFSFRDKNTQPKTEEAKETSESSESMKEVSKPESVSECESNTSVTVNEKCVPPSPKNQSESERTSAPDSDGTTEKPSEPIVSSDKSVEAVKTSEEALEKVEETVTEEEEKEEEPVEEDEVPEQKMTRGRKRREEASLVNGASKEESKTVRKTRSKVSDDSKAAAKAKAGAAKAKKDGEKCSKSETNESQNETGNDDASQEVKVKVEEEGEEKIEDATSKQVNGDVEKKGSKPGDPYYFSEDDFASPPGESGKRGGRWRGRRGGIQSPELSEGQKGIFGRFGGRTCLF